MMKSANLSVSTSHWRRSPHLWLIGSVLSALLSVFAIGSFVDVLREGAESAHWPSTQGTVLRSDLLSNEDGYWPVVTYQYEVDVVLYQGTGIRVFGAPSGSYEEAQRIMNQYPVGARVSVYYDPARPRRAVLEPGMYVLPATVLVWAALVPGFIAWIFFNNWKTKRAWRLGRMALG